MTSFISGLDAVSLIGPLATVPYQAMARAAVGPACVLIAGLLAFDALRPKRRPKRASRAIVWGFAAFTLLVGLAFLGKMVGFAAHHPLWGVRDLIMAVVSWSVAIGLVLDSKRKRAPADRRGEGEGEGPEAVTSPRELREALRRSERNASRLQLFANRTDNAMMITDARWRVEWVNEGFSRITGYSFEEVRRRTPGAFLSGPETDPGTLSFIRQRLRAGEGVRTEILNYTKSGRKYWVALEIQPIFGDNGKLVNFFSVQSDITERKRAERRMEVQHAAMQILAACSRLGEAVPHLLATIGLTLDFDVAEFWSWDHEAETLRLVGKPWTSRRTDPRWLAQTEPTMPIARLAKLPGQVWTSGKPAWIENLATVEAGSLSRSRLAAECGLRSAVLVPVSLGENSPVVGVMTFLSREALPRDEPLLQALSTMGRQIGLFAERKKAVSELIEVNSRLNAVLDASTQASIIATDPNGVITVFNTGAERMLGYSAAEMVGKTTPLALHDQTEIEVHAANLSAELGLPVHGVETLTTRARLGGHDVREWTYIRKDGTRLPVLLAVTAVRAPEGRINGYLGVATDLSARQKAERQVRESEARLRRLVEANIFGVIFGDLTGIVTDANDAFLEMVDHTRDELVRGELHWGQSVAPSSVRLIQRCRAQLEKHGICSPFEIEVRRKDGRTLPILLGLALLDQGRPLDGHSQVVAFCLDLTERKQLEDDLRQHASDLAEADHRKNQFLAMLGHELRNPLAPIRNAVKVMEQRGAADPNPDPDLAWACEVIDRQVRQLSHLVDDLLEIARVTRGKIRLQLEAVDAATIVAYAVETSRPEIDAHRHQLSIELPDSQIMVMADSLRMAQVLSNLLHNAAKYTEDGGRIQLSAVVENDQVLFRVRDDGIGIPAPMLSRIFDLFTQVDRTLDRSEGGLGLGLTLVRSLVEMHGGTVEAQSDGLGQGSEFTVRLPRWKPAEPEIATEAPRAEEPPAQPETQALDPPTTRGRRVLVVDDNVSSAESLAMILKFEGHDVQIVHDGPDALQTICADGFDVVFMDIGLPGMDGYEVARKLRDRPDLAALPLVAVTGYAEDDARGRSHEAGFDHHFVKPVDPDAILAFLATLANDENPPQEAADG